MQGLSKFGYEFQVKLITCLLTDIQFNSRVYDILKPDYFDSEALNWLCSVILKYYETYHALATMPVLKYEIDSIENDLLREEVVRVLSDVVINQRETDLRFIKDATIEFCKNQELRYAIVESVDLLKDGKFEEIKRRIDDALKKGDAAAVGHDYLNEIDERYEIKTRKPITTGWPYIDELTQGGLSAGELGVIVGNSGSGKSWCLSHMCAKAMEAGYKALYVTLELWKTDIGVRIDCILTHVPMYELPFQKDVIRDRLSHIRQKGGKILIEWFPTKQLSIIGVRSLLDKLVMLNDKPDILFIDYADLMRLNTSKQKRKDEELQELYEELRGIAGEYEIPIWTVSQANRSSHNDEVEFVTADMIAESMGKHYTADFMMSINRKEKDKLDKTARFHVIKNRRGTDGYSLYAKMDLTNGEINIFRHKGKEHMEMENSAVEDAEVVKKRLKDRHSKFFEPKPEE